MISPLSSGGHKFIIIATEYFTKWVEAAPMNKTIGTQIAKFIDDHIITRVGVPAKIITDNGKQFKNEELAMFYQSLGI